MLSEVELRYSSQSVCGNTSLCVLVDCIQDHCETPVCPWVVGMNCCYFLGSSSILIPCKWKRLSEHTVCVSVLAAYSSPPLGHSHFNICFPNAFSPFVHFPFIHPSCPLPFPSFTTSPARAKLISRFPLISCHLLFSNTFCSQLTFIKGATC